jgi:hypothetical protein
MEQGHSAGDFLIRNSFRPGEFLRDFPIRDLTVDKVMKRTARAAPSFYRYLEIQVS